MKTFLFGAFVLVGTALLFLYVPFILIRGLINPSRIKNGDRKLFLKDTLTKWLVGFILFVIIGAIFAPDASDNPPATPQNQPTQTTVNTVAETPKPDIASTPKPQEKKHEVVKKENPPKKEVGLETTTKEMDFDSCIALQSQFANELISSGNYKVVNIVDTDILSIKRMCTNDGSVLVTCSKPDNKMVLTKSPHQDGCK